MHEQTHVHAGQTMTLSRPLRLQPPTGMYDGRFTVEDWWDRVAGVSWKHANGNPAAMIYGMRSAFAELPFDDEVVYGHDESGFGHLVHVSELGEVVT